MPRFGQAIVLGSVLGSIQLHALSIGQLNGISGDWIDCYGTVLEQSLCHQVSNKISEKLEEHDLTLRDGVLRWSATGLLAGTKEKKGCNSVKVKHDELDVYYDTNKLAFEFPSSGLVGNILRAHIPLDFTVKYKADLREKRRVDSYLMNHCVDPTDVDNYKLRARTETSGEVVLTFSNEATVTEDSSNYYVTIAPRVMLEPRLSHLNLEGRIEGRDNFSGLVYSMVNLPHSLEREFFHALGKGLYTGDPSYLYDTESWEYTFSNAGQLVVSGILGADQITSGMIQDWGNRYASTLARKKARDFAAGVSTDAESVLATRISDALDLDSNGRRTFQVSKGNVAGRLLISILSI